MINRKERQGRKENTGEILAFLASFAVNFCFINPLIGLFDLKDPHLAEQSEKILRDSIKSHSGWITKE